MQNDTMQETSSNAKNEVQAMKEDIRDIVKRLGNLKKETVDALSEEIEQLMSTMYNLKDKAMDKGTDSIRWVRWCIHKCPIQSALYAFGVGIVVSLLWRR